MQILILNEFLYVICCEIKSHPKSGVSVHDTIGVRIRTVVVMIFVIGPKTKNLYVSAGPKKTIFIINSDDYLFSD